DRLERESQALEALAQHAVRGARLLVRLGPSIYERPHRFVTVEIRHGHLELVGRGLAPDTRTLSLPTCSSRMVVKSAMQSGVMYAAGSPISYTSCSVTPATLMRPPVPGCFEISNVPSGRASTIGYPTLARSGIRSQSTRQLPPLHCAPHSIV